MKQPDTASLDIGKKTNLALGAVMVVVGLFLVVSLNNDLELYVLIAGPILMLLGLGAIMVVFVRQLPAAATWLGAACVLLGAVLFVHDLALPPTPASIAHIGSAILVLVLGVLSLLGRINLLARFRKTAPPPA